MSVRTKPLLSLDATDNRLFDVLSYPAQSIPETVGMLVKRTSSTSYAAPNTVNGIDMISRCILSLYQSSEGRIVESIDRLYRLTDAIGNGRSYAIVAGKPESVPVIPFPATYEGSVRGLLLQIVEKLDSSTSGDLDDEMLAELVKIALTLV